MKKLKTLSASYLLKLGREVGKIAYQGLDETGQLPTLLARKDPRLSSSEYNNILKWLLLKLKKEGQINFNQKDLSSEKFGAFENGFIEELQRKGIL